MTPKGNPTPCNNPPNHILNVPAESDSDPGFSDSSWSDSYDSSDDEYYKRIQHAKNNKKKQWNKTRSGDPIKKYAKLTANLLTAA